MFCEFPDALPSTLYLKLWMHLVWRNCQYCDSTVIPRSYIIGGSETGGVSQDNISQGRFSQMHNIKVGRVESRKSILTKEETYSYLTKIDIKYELTTI